MIRPITSLNPQQPLQKPLSTVRFGNQKSSAEKPTEEEMQIALAIHRWIQKTQASPPVLQSLVPVFQTIVRGPEQSYYASPVSPFITTYWKDEDGIRKNLSIQLMPSEEGDAFFIQGGAQTEFPQDHKTHFYDNPDIGKIPFERGMRVESLIARVKNELQSAKRFLDQLTRNDLDQTLD